MTGSSGYEDDAFIADLYAHVTSYRDRPDVGFFVEAGRAAGSPVLEIGCRTGRVLIPTARAGLDIVGLDLSPHMLAVCRQRRARVHARRGSRRMLDGQAQFEGSDPGRCATCGNFLRTFLSKVASGRRRCTASSTNRVS
jgi:SAM-dependent methyltransferase